MPALVLAIGESLIELRQAGGDELRWTFAGDSLNCAAAIAAAHTTATVKHLTGVGDDERSSEFREFCATLGIDASGSPAITGKSLGLYWITTHDGDRRFTYWRNDSAAKNFLQSSELTLPEPRPDLVLFSGITLAVAGPSARHLLDQIERARDQGATIAYDTNHRPALCPDLITSRTNAERALALADIVHASADDVAELWSGESTQVDSWPAAFGISELLVTDGDHPVRVLADGNHSEVAPAAVQVVDTSGAGDAFFGTYLGHRLAEVSISDALTLALDVSARVVQSPGALTYLLERG